ncbi:MAG: glycerol kinase GlpK [Opitutus sp.]|nr:glycerol kinase GlpK [Opitutus sp.]MCS6247898.1 glycerol kinase GlpK [Opitutus sp.]MCS6274100.1 glycerol kinase GlpK [Opitutus sp.]MCS6277477.1 glycerol kinase GlpK [Opitutus sp.]MCS6300595.1 glycerol kinase GlpK [Opitutus sp.]
MSSPRHILALDQGTTSSRALIFDHSGRIVAAAQKEFTQYYPTPGWVEHDPRELWASQRAVITEVLARAQLPASDFAAIGLTNQRETTLVWDRATGQPVYNAIVWQDRRTADDCAQLRSDGHEPGVTTKTGLRLDPYFSATKLRWILNNVPGARDGAEAGRLLFGTVDSWLLWQLTGGRVHATDVTNASRTLLCNLHTGDWDDELLTLFEIPRALLPQIRSCSEIYGHVGTELPELTGVPIAGVAGDQQAALFGQTCFQPGMAKNTYGTGCFTLMHTGDQPVVSRHHLLTTPAWKIGGRTEYALEGSVFIGGAAIQWLRDELQLVRDAAELDRLAESVPDAGGLFLVPAFAGLGAPHWDPFARGTMVGITRGTNRAQLCRAVIEAIGLQTADLIRCMEKDSGLPLRELRVDGGAARSAPLLQFQADLLGVDVVRPRCIETTALGAAYLAGLATGFWSNREEIARHWTIDRTFTPQRSTEDIARLRADWDLAVGAARAFKTSGR